MLKSYEEQDFQKATALAGRLTKSTSEYHTTFKNPITQRWTVTNLYCERIRRSNGDDA